MLPVGVLHVVLHDEEAVRGGRHPAQVEEPVRVGGRAGIGVDREVGAAAHRRPQADDQVGHHRARALSVGAGAVKALVVDVDAVHALGLHLLDGQADGGRPVLQARAHARRAGREVLEDDRLHHAHPFGVGGVEQAGQLSRVPDHHPVVVDEGPVGRHVEAEDRHRGEEVEVPARVADGGIGEAAREREAEDLALGPADGPPAGGGGLTRGEGSGAGERRQPGH